MMKPADEPTPSMFHQPSTLRHVIWRGTSIIAPPLVTLLLVIWLLNAIEEYVLTPLETGVRSLVVAVIADIVEEAPPGSKLLNEDNPDAGFTYEGFTYVHPPLGRRYLPRHILDHVNASLDRLPREMQRPVSVTDYYEAYVKLRYMPRSFTIPLLFLLLLSGLFFVGRFFAAGVGRFIVRIFEGIILQIPFISNIYNSVKQVTDFVLSEREMQFTRVVAIEYPKVGIWSMGFVTSESIPQLKQALNTELISVFVPTSPMPMTGYTVNLPRGEVIDLDLTIDQAVQFMVSCGVVCPSLEKPRKAGAKSALLRSRREPDPPEQIS